MAILAQLVDGVVTHKFDVSEKGLSIGRLPQNDVIIPDASVSSQHAVLEVTANENFPDIMEYFVRDLNSTNGTEINGVKIQGSVQLHHNDEITVAWNTFKFIDEDSVNLSKTAHIVTPGGPE